MLKKIFKKLFKITEFFLAVFILLFSLLLIRLWIGPIHIEKELPRLINMFDSTLQVSAKQAYIELALKQGRLFDVKTTDLSLIKEQVFLFEVNQAQASISPLSLLKGKLILKNILLQKPHIKIDMSQQTLIAPQKQTNPISTERKINRLRRYFENLNTFHIQDGKITFLLPNNQEILIPSFNISSNKKKTDTSLNIAGKLYFDKTSMDFELDGSYSTHSHQALLELKTKNVDLFKLQKVLPVLQNAHLVIDSQIMINLNFNDFNSNWKNIFQNITFATQAKNQGTLYLPEPLNTYYTIEQASLQGNISAGLKKIIVKESKFKLYGQNALLNAEVDNLDDFLETGDFSKIKTSLIASLQNINLHDVPELWPSYLGTDAHEWIKQNVPTGIITHASLNLSMQGDSITDLVSILKIKEAKVIYLDTMAPIEKIQATVKLTPQMAKIDIDNALCNGLNITGGTVQFLDLDKEDTYFDTHAFISGSVNKALNLVSADPLFVCQSMPISCKTMQGQFQGELQLNFPFSDTLEDEITFSLNTNIDELSLPVPQTNWKINNGNLKLFVNMEKMNLSGVAEIDGKPIQLNLHQNLDNLEDGNYTFHLPISPSLLQTYLPNIDSFLKGNLLAEISLQPQKDKNIVSVSFDLEDAEITLPIGYTKEFKQKGVLKAILELKNDKLSQIPTIYFSVPQDSILIEGEAKRAKNNTTHLIFSKIKTPKTDAQLVADFSPNNLVLKITGNSLDISNLLHGNFFGNKTPIKDAMMKSSASTKNEFFKMNLSLQKLYLSKDLPFTEANLNLLKEKGSWQQFSGSLQGAKPFTFELKEDQLKAQTNDLGDFLKRTGYTNRIAEGSLNALLSQKENGAISGEIQMKDFKFTETSFFMQAATLLGIIDALTGTDYILFDKAIIPFEISADNVISIQDAEASGTTLGLTLRGTASTKQIDLAGSVVPAYAINSLAGKIPLIGKLFSGEKGGGLIGVTYSIKGKPSSIQLKFNPASVLAPGIFRRLF